MSKIKEVLLDECFDTYIGGSYERAWEEEEEEEFKTISSEEREKMQKIQQERIAMNEKKLKAERFLKELGIPIRAHEYYEWPAVDAGDLYDILMDEGKLKIILFKLRNKAFL